MKCTRALLIAVPASALFLMAAPLTAFAAGQRTHIPELQQTAMQQMIPAEWRADRYLAETSMTGTGNQGIRMLELQQTAMQRMIPAEWRADRYLAETSMTGTGNQGIRMLELQQTAMQQMIPAEWRADRYLAEEARACG